MKRFLFVLLLLLGVMQHRLWFGENSLPEYFNLSHQIQLQQQNNGQLVARNQVLKEEITDLRSGTGALAERARNELGMVKKGETLLLFDYQFDSQEYREVADLSKFSNAPNHTLTITSSHDGDVVLVNLVDNLQSDLVLMSKTTAN